MTKLIYNGVMAKGQCVCGSFSIPVKKGETYDVPDSVVDKLLQSGLWKKPEQTEKKVKKEKLEEDD